MGGKSRRRRRGSRRFHGGGLTAKSGIISYSPSKGK
jgi:hypothetical protein